jgi:Na+/H+ antiporter NhaD/arsenite permease-like protein
MLVAHLSGLTYRAYLVKAGVPAAAGLIVTAGMLHWLCRGDLRAPQARTAEIASEPIVGQRRLLMVSLFSLAVVSLLFFLGANLAFSALGGATLMMVLRRRDPAPLFDKVAWTVLVFFGALFVVVAGLQKTGLPALALEHVTPFMPTSRAGGLTCFGSALIVGCQIVSNVPFILLAEPWLRTLPDQSLAWVGTALFSTLAGNLTLLGSVANIIVIETTGAERELGFVRYLKVGVPVTVASSIVAGALLLITSPW